MLHIHLENGWRCIVLLRVVAQNIHMYKMDSGYFLVYFIYFLLLFGWYMHKRILYWATYVLGPTRYRTFTKYVCSTKTKTLIDVLSCLWATKFILKNSFDTNRESWTKQFPHWKKNWGPNGLNPNIATFIENRDLCTLHVYIPTYVCVYIGNNVSSVSNL